MKGFHKQMQSETPVHMPTSKHFITEVLAYAGQGPRLPEDPNTHIGALQAFFGNEDAARMTSSGTCALKCFETFLPVWQSGDAKHAETTLDYFLTEWARWSLSTRVLDVKEKDIKAYEEHKQRTITSICGQDAKVYNLQPQSFVRYICDVVAMYNRMCSPGVYVNSEQRYPLFWRFMIKAVERSKIKRMTDKVGNDDPNNYVTEEEMAKVEDVGYAGGTDHVQYTTFAVLGFRTGIRGTSVRALIDEAVPEIHPDSQFIEFNLHKQKQHQLKLDPADLNRVFTRPLMRSASGIACPLKSLDRQRTMCPRGTDTDPKV